MKKENISELLLQLLKFGVVGCCGLLIDFGVTYLLKEKANVNKYIANGCGFTVAVCSNFFLNKIWTFEDTQRDYLPQFTAFFAVAAGGLLINQFVLYLLHERFKLNFYFAKILAIGVVTFWNFGLSHSYVFNA